MQLSTDGVLDGAIYLASPNCDQRPELTQIELIVLHNISLPPGEFGGSAVAQLFTNRLVAAAHPYYATIAQLRVSAHFFVRRDGSIMQFVPCVLRAWHAGESSWRGRSRCNDFAVGIELEGTDAVPFAQEQYAALVPLVRAIKGHYPSVSAIAGHQDIAPARKTDPGPHFDWGRLQAALPTNLSWRA